VSGLPRVIFVNRVYWPSTAATAQLLTDLAEGLAVRGWPVEVIATGTDDTVRNGVSIHRTGAGGEHGGMISRARNYRKFLRDAAAKITALARPNDILVPMTDPPMLGAAVAQAAPAGAHVVHWIQDIYPEIAAAHFGFLASLALEPLRRKRDAAWSSAAGCVALGEDMAALVSEQGVSRNRITILPNWAPRELHVQPPAADLAELRTRWGLADKFIVAYSGNLGRVHDSDTLIEAAARLRDAPGITLLFVGSGARFERIARSARQRALGNIRLLPAVPRSQLPQLLGAADAHLVTLLPAYRQLVYPSKLAGVLAAGRPVLFVGPADSEIARLVRESGCGAACLPGDATGLAQLIRRLADDAALRKGQSERARQLYTGRFTGDAALAGWDALLRRVATRR
jgi:colanic acid biosynthesis glycosyl transferase WcaI